MNTSDTLLNDPPEYPRLETWRCEMRQRHGPRIEIQFTNNRRNMVSLQRKAPGRVALRLQKGFETAPEQVFRDLEDVVIHNHVLAWKRVCSYAKTIPVPCTPSLTELSKPLPTRGAFHDLQQLLDEVNHRFFEGRLETRITWGRKPPPVRRRRRRRSHSFQFGVWDQSRNLIRIHPDLDRRGVPREFMRYLVHHECCHAASPPDKGDNGHRRIHHARFKELEAQFPHREKMETLSHRLFERIVKER